MPQQLLRYTGLFCRFSVVFQEHPGASGSRPGASGSIREHSGSIQKHLGALREHMGALWEHPGASGEPLIASGSMWSMCWPCLQCNTRWREATKMSKTKSSQNGLWTYPELPPYQLRPSSTYPNPPISHSIGKIENCDFLLEFPLLFPIIWPFPQEAILA